MAIDVQNVVTWLKNWFYDKTEVYSKSETYSSGEVDTALGNKVNISQGSGNSGKNVYINSSGNVDVENHITCGSGLAFDGSVANKINHSNSITAQTSTVFKKFKYDAQGHITGTGNVQSSDLPSHTHNSTQITDSNTYSYFTPSDDTQSEINKAIDSAIGSLSSINAIEVVTTKPTASASTMGKLYIVSENSKVNVYYTEQSGTGSSATYSWHKMDTDILDELSIDWSDVQNKPTKTSDFTNDGSDGTSTYVEADELSTVATTGDYDDLIDKPTIPTDVSDLTDTDNTAFTPKSHTHGNITNDGKIGTNSNKVIVTTTGGALTTRSFDTDVTAGSSNMVTSGSVYTACNNIQIDVNGMQQDISALYGDIGSLESTRVSSIALIPKGSDPTADAYNGVIRLYYGDEPS